MRAERRKKALRETNRPGHLADLYFLSSFFLLLMEAVHDQFVRRQASTTGAGVLERLADIGTLKLDAEMPLHLAERLRVGDSGAAAIQNHSS